jgi:L-ascorbate metabolism protein UlaG (beta-lactamase superfamily)
MLAFFLLQHFTLRAQPQFGHPSRLTNQEFVLKISVFGNQSNFRIDGASSLPEWTPLSVLLSSGLNQYTDSAAPYFPSRYYRAVTLSDTNALTGDYLSTDDGDVLFHPVNHATFLMQWKDIVIYNDPVGSTYYARLPKAGLVLVGHEHTDHFNATIMTTEKTPSAKIVTTETVYNSLSIPARASTIVLTNGAGTNLLGIDILAVPAYNTTSTYHRKGLGNGYLLTIGGKRIYISGDTEDTPEMLALTNIDVAFLCINLPYTMSITKAAAAVRQFRPKVVYPYHYRNGDNTFSDLKSFKQKVGSDLGIEVRLRKWY